MSSLPAKVPVTFLTGHSSRNGVLGVVAFPDETADTGVKACRFFTYANGQWGWLPQDFPFDCRSVTYLAESRGDYKAWWILGKDGETVEIQAGSTTVDHIPGSGLRHVVKGYGYMWAIKAIAEELYACGYGRQVYKREGGQWRSISDPLLTHEPVIGFLDIDGSSASSIYAVGYQGEIYFYDGAQWHRDDSPTTAHLASVRCVSDDEVWIVGSEGVVLKGRYNKWQVVEEGPKENWWSVESFKGVTYLSGVKQLARVDGAAVASIDPGLGRAYSTYHLRARDSFLWSIGRKDILVFDGTSWKEIVHPDNA